MFIFLKEELNQMLISIAQRGDLSGVWSPSWNMVQPSVIGYFWWVFVACFWQERTCQICYALYKKKIYINQKNVTDCLGHVKVWKGFAWGCPNKEWEYFLNLISENFMQLNFGEKRIKDYLRNRASWELGSSVF